MNKMKEVAELLGVQLNKEFIVIDRNGNERTTKYSFSEKGLFTSNGYFASDTLFYLLTGEYKIKKPILDKVEKKYLENVLRPFKDKVKNISKHVCGNCDVIEEYIYIEFTCDNVMLFPTFEQGKMYKGMAAYKYYSLKELGLFDNE